MSLIFNSSMNRYYYFNYYWRSIDEETEKLSIWFKVMYLEKGRALLLFSVYFYSDYLITNLIKYEVLENFVAHHVLVPLSLQHYDPLNSSSLLASHAQSHKMHTALSTWNRYYGLVHSAPNLIPFLHAFVEWEGWRATTKKYIKYVFYPPQMCFC